MDAHLKVVRGDARGRVYALGDCAHVEGHSLPCTAQAAERQGRYLAKALSSEQPEPFVFKPWGMLAYVGGYKALHDTPMGKSQGVALSDHDCSHSFLPAVCVCRISLLDTVALCLHHSAWQLEAEDAGAYRLDEGILLRPRHLEILTAHTLSSHAQSTEYSILLYAMK